MNKRKFKIYQVSSQFYLIWLNFFLIKSYVRVQINLILLKVMLFRKKYNQKKKEDFFQSLIFLKKGDSKKQILNYLNHKKIKLSIFKNSKK